MTTPTQAPQAMPAAAKIGAPQFRELPDAPPSARLTASTGQPGGLGDGMIPNIVGGLYGIKRFSSVVPVDLGWDYFPGVTQHASMRIDGTFYVYHELGHGDDDYVVVYQEDGIVSLGDLIKDEALARGFFMYRMDTAVAPDPNGNGVSWVASSPATVNQTETVTNQTVDTFDETINLGVTPDGASGGVSISQSTQVWHGFDMKVSDWNITETTDAATSRCSWMWWQNIPWAGNDKSTGDFTWWEQAYNVGGGWDDTKPFPELSRTTLQYHASAAWRFDGSLRAGDSLPVTFNGGATYYLAGINMPQCADNGHHQMWWNTPSNDWTMSFDLAQVSSGK